MVLWKDSKRRGHEKNVSLKAEMSEWRQALGKQGCHTAEAATGRL